ncbi:hydroxymethylpyrimidine/phosphomethylpyrimidine kinase [Pedobacter sp. SYP-B3415]|uniref:hydroxymethylpyrimidine/phosphomethylpyrimidine kinase n=1 Tax=Pedobacter sp. SYP-B3415 TaxID=2496641 RepID=UPI00101D0C7D|nr:hydroxymethylpyrimidine/phosphomethylpyrimidine kinase [Pedobacter sp. SYP-B3415]
MGQARPYALSIAGFDPTGGAGVLADVKTFEQYRCMGLAALTATTVQTPAEMRSLLWFSLEEILAQVSPLFETCQIEAVKIGIIPDLQTLDALLTSLHAVNNSITIIWDPVLQSSSGYRLFADADGEAVEHVLSQITLLTPNADEVQILGRRDDPLKAAAQLSLHTAVLLKGGHLSERSGTDFLFAGGKLTATFPPGQTGVWPKHGSGCILSAAVAAGLANGDDLFQACRNAKSYTEKRLAGNAGLLAYHHE